MKTLNVNTTVFKLYQKNSFRDASLIENAKNTCGKCQGDYLEENNISFISLYSFNLFTFYFNTTYLVNTCEISKGPVVLLVFFFFFF